VRKHTVRALLLVVLGLAAAWLLAERAGGRLIVENDSGQPVSRLTVRIAGATMAFQAVAPGAKVSASFRAAEGDRFVVRGQLADGTVLSADYGYTGGWLTGPTYFIIRRGGQMEFRQGRAGA